MSVDPEARIEELGIVVPEAPAPAAAYLPSREGGGLVFVAGQVPLVDGTLPRTGKLGRDLDTEEGMELAQQAALNVLAVLKAAAGGDLRRVRVAKLTVFVASDPSFTEQHLVANGASRFLADVLGDDGLHARSAVGVPVLPLDSPVEVEAIAEIRPI